MIRGSCPSARKVLLTKCALRQASMPTMQGGSFLNASANDNLLIFQRNAILPFLSKPTTWKTSFPISMPTEARGIVILSTLRAMAASPVVRGCEPLQANPLGEAAGPSHYQTTERPGSLRPVERYFSHSQPFVQ